MSFAIKVTDASSSFFLSNCDSFWVDLKKAVMGLDVDCSSLLGMLVDWIFGTMGQMVTQVCCTTSRSVVFQGIFTKTTEHVTSIL